MTDTVVELRGERGGVEWARGHHCADEFKREAVAPLARATGECAQDRQSRAAGRSAAGSRRAPGRYGAPRHPAGLRAAGRSVSRQRVARVMRRHGIRAQAPRRCRVCATDSTHSLAVAANRPERMSRPRRPTRAFPGEHRGLRLLSTILPTMAASTKCRLRSTSPRSPTCDCNAASTRFHTPAARLR